MRNGEPWEKDRKCSPSVDRSRAIPYAQQAAMRRGERVFNGGARSVDIPYQLKRDECLDFADEGEDSQYRSSPNRDGSYL